MSSQPLRQASLARVAFTLALALPAAWVCQALSLPLPWMIGPLLVTAFASVAGAPTAASNLLRNSGLWLVGAALGLTFTPQVLALLWPLSPAVVGGAFWTLLMGYGFYRFLARDPGVDRATAFFSSAIGGASEMAVLAERHQAQIDRVAAAHSLRVLLVVVVVPMAYQVLGVHGADTSSTALRALRPQGLFELLLISGAGVLALRWLRTPNPWVLGPLLATAAFAAGGAELSALPRPAVNLCQLLIGVSLGTRFTPSFVQAAPRWLRDVALGSMVMMALSALFGWALAWVISMPAATVMLGLAPGGIAEMSLTAKVLQLGVPVVTVFQLTRYLAVLLLTPSLYRWECRRLGTPSGPGARPE